jgi:hypothetical protein
MKIEKNKIIIYLCILLCAQIVIFALINIFSSQNLKSQEIGKLLLSGLKKDNIVSLEIKDSIGAFSIEKKDNSWVIISEKNSLPGDKEKIDAYIDQLVKTTAGVVVYNGSDASSDKTFGFGEKNNQVLTVKTKTKSYTINIGNPGSKRSSSYVKFNNEKKVREVPSNISSSTSNSPGMWAVKNIFSSVKFEDVISCEVVSKFDWFKGNYKITSNGMTDKNLKLTIEPAVNKELQEYALENFIRGILGLSISEYKLNGGVEGKEAIGTLKLLLKDKKEVAVEVYKADNTDPGAFIIKSSLSNYLYLISEDMAKTLFKNTRDFVKTEPKK